VAVGRFFVRLLGFLAGFSISYVLAPWADPVAWLFYGLLAGWLADALCAPEE